MKLIEKREPHPSLFSTAKKSNALSLNPESTLKKKKVTILGALESSTKLKRSRAQLNADD